MRIVVVLPVAVKLGVGQVKAYCIRVAAGVWRCVFIGFGKLCLVLNGSSKRGDNKLVPITLFGKAFSYLKKDFSCIGMEVWLAMAKVINNKASAVAYALNLAFVRCLAELR